MADEAAFLAEIQATPGDPTPRLVYADWLEEHGDLRADLIRIEERMRQLPVFSEEFWQLKPLRNTLRTQAAPVWLQALHYTDYPPTFKHGVPDGWRDRWRLVREFIDRWHQFPLGDVGGRADEIREIETHLGRTLPPSLREWVAFVQDLRPSAYYYEVIRDYFQMREFRGVSAVSFLWQDEGDYVWAVRHADLALPDPPVYGFGRDDEDEDDRTLEPDPENPVAASVTAFVLERVLGSPSGAGGSFRTGVRRPARLVRDLESAFPVRSRYEDRDIFEAENLLVQLYPSRVARDTELVVKVARPLPREAIPAFLWDYTNNGGGFHGMFAEAHLRARELRLPDHDAPRAGEAGEIPF